MADLLFSQDKHRYTLNGEILPSVTDLCRFLHREIYASAPSWQMEAAAQRGTAVHAAAEALDRTGTAEIPNDFAPYLEAYLAFLRDYSPAWELIEYPTYHPEDLYAGTIDRYGLLSGFSSLVDIKTTYTVYKPLCAAQLNLYRRMLMAQGFRVDKLYILHLRRDGTYRLRPFPVEDALATALLTLHNALKKRPRKKGGNHV